MIAAMIVIALGANLPSRFGGPDATLEAALAVLPARGLTVAKRSRLWRTAPVPFDPAQPWYYNAVVSVETGLTPEAVLETLLDIEREFGRVRSVRNAARILDLDLISYHDTVRHEPGLTLPHPRMHERGFVLYPLRDIAPEWVHPVSGRKLDEMIAALPAGQKAEAA